MGAAVELSQHRASSITVARLRVDPPVELNGGIDPEGDGTFPVDGARLSLGVGADELDRIGVGRIVLLVDRLDDLERDPQLLQNRPPLRRGRCEDERAAHSGFFATQISSAGHFFAQATGT